MSIVFTLCLFFGLVAAFHLHNYLSSRSYIESGLAGNIHADPSSIPQTQRISRRTVIVNQGVTFDLSKKNINAICPAGKSMTQRGIHPGDLVIFDNSKEITELKDGDVIAIRMIGKKHKKNRGRIKLRIFSHCIEGGLFSRKEIHVKRYNLDGELVEAEFSHPARAYQGKMVAHFDESVCERLKGDIATG